MNKKYASCSICKQRYLCIEVPKKIDKQIEEDRKRKGDKPLKQQYMFICLSCGLKSKYANDVLCFACTQRTKESKSDNAHTTEKLSYIHITNHKRNGYYVSSHWRMGNNCNTKFK